MTEREPPKRLIRLRDAWLWYMKSWRIAHYSIGIGGTLCATAVASKPVVLDTLPLLRDSLAWVSAACIGTLTLLRPHRRANAYAAAWRLLNDACNRFAIDPNFSEQGLLDAATKGEEIIQASDPTS